ncbi:hypothetical protein EV363DRAFT_1251276 [Boletus edulis]|nr:hypothetical protein EV363DRAFT_1251276 [Boletus edulis]
MALATPVRTGAAAAVTAATPYRAYPHQQSAQRAGPNITDDYERWYTEQTSNNRMVLSLRSTINTEIGWALDRLHRLCTNDLFMLKSLPGLTNALFDWPEWYAREGHFESENYPFFSLSPEADRRRRHAIESLFVLRNSATNEPNALELAECRRTQPLIFDALINLDPDSDANTEFILNIIELLQSISFRIVLPPLDSGERNPLQTLLRIAGHSPNRTLIVSALSVLGQLFLYPPNVSRLQADSPALEASIRYLPLFMDKPLVEASLNYLYAHLSHPPMGKAFLLHPSMPSTLKVLVSLLLVEQVEEEVSVDITGSVRTIPANTTFAAPDHDLTSEELDRLLPLPEPTRCYEWMKTMFVAEPECELTQVDFWNLYKDAFSPHVELFPVLVASEVIKNVNTVFEHAQAMVLPGPPQRFVVRGVSRRKETQASQQFKCQWDRSQCSAPPSSSAGELYDHLIQHVNDLEASYGSCHWSTCGAARMPKSYLRLHVLTHIPSSQPPPRHPSQDDNITIAVDDNYPLANPTLRPPPPPRSTSVKFPRPVVDPPSSSLTALLIIRILFHTSFVAADLAPRPDGERFGFPGVVEEDDGEVMSEDYGGEVEGERKGRRAFVGVRRMLEGVRMKDEALASWIAEMVDAGFDGLLQ